jgi:hypothetical protein
MTYNGQDNIFIHVKKARPNLLVPWQCAFRLLNIMLQPKH